MAAESVVRNYAKQGRSKSSNSFSASKVTRVVATLVDATSSGVTIRERWLAAVAARVAAARPDLLPALYDVLQVEPLESDILNGLSIGEVSVCYEALLSHLSLASRKSAGQFFTPDDAARFMAEQARSFGEGIWLDPCCGVGNLAWHLAGTMSDPAVFVRENLVLMDRDETARRSAVALIAAEYVADGDLAGVRGLDRNSVRRDFLSRAVLPYYDFAILNPPYARSEYDKRYETGPCRDLYAFFMERVAKTSIGYVAVTPAAYLSSPKFQALRDVLDRESKGGEILVFDNVPDTLFRGYKFGSTNTSKTNFVRAAITVCAPDADGWRITPIIRWQVSVRSAMFEECRWLLAPRQLGPGGEWAKVGPFLQPVWEFLDGQRSKLADLVVAEKTNYFLDVGLTPRYYISATRRSLDRGSKATLYFRNAEDLDRASLVLNSSIPYIWWRVLDGGVTLTSRILLSVPMPEILSIEPMVLKRLCESERENLVFKLNAGRVNQNVKHSPELVSTLNKIVLPAEVDLDLLYSNNMFPLSADTLNYEKDIEKEELEK